MKASASPCMPRHCTRAEWLTACLPQAFGGSREMPYIPREELATRSISTVFRARGLCLAFSFRLVAST